MSKAYQIYECGICGSYHAASWEGDCRENENRFADPEDFAKRRSLHLSAVEIVDMPGTEADRG